MMAAYFRRDTRRRARFVAPLNYCSGYQVLRREIMFEVAKRGALRYFLIAAPYRFSLKPSPARHATGFRHANGICGYALAAATSHFAVFRFHQQVLGALVLRRHLPRMTARRHGQRRRHRRTTRRWGHVCA